jgi:predicted MPP superfamily phosphohydrolase
LKNENLKNYLNEYIFPYNKGMRKELSSIGTELDIIAFIINWINPMPNPKIFLEEKDDLEKKYSVIMIIDNSFSCLNEITINHTINTIRVI